MTRPFRAVRTPLAAALSGRFCVAAGVSLLAATSAAQAVTTSRLDQRLVDGRVVRPAGAEVRGVKDVWVVLHRVGSDRAAPLDSMRSAADGTFRFRYLTQGASAAVYFLSAQFGGIAYFSEPLRGANVAVEDAVITVFDTTSRAVPLRVRGRHVVVGASSVNGVREIVEVFEISNDTSITLVSPDDARPTWTTRVPAEAADFRPAQSDISAAAMRLRDGKVSVIAPVAPGLKQISFSYQLPASSFPLSIPLERETDVLEVLLEDRMATVDGARLSAMAAVTVEGRTFRRFVASDVPANSVMRISVPAAQSSSMALYVGALAVAIGAAMLLSLAKTFARSAVPISEHQVDRVSPPDDPDRIAMVIASLDDDFERRGDTSQPARDAYEEERARLKGRLEKALDARRTQE